MTDTFFSGVNERREWMKHAQQLTHLFVSIGGFHEGFFE
jgi:hypothetical protein